MSIIDNSGIAFEDFFSFPVEFACDLMNLVFLAAGLATHADPSALAMDLKFAGAFFTFHGVSLQKLGAGKYCFEGVTGLRQGFGTAFLSFNHRRHQADLETGRFDSFDDF
jgi:hypothetical protein